MNYMRTLVYNLIEILHSIRKRGRERGGGGVGKREGEGGDMKSSEK